MKQYPIHERFMAFQGEGVHMGRPAFFVRTYGCPVHCPWCDSAGTWHPDWTPKGVEKMTAFGIVQEAYNHNPEFIVVTGGEPAVHDLSSLTTEAGAAMIPVHLETSGAFPLKGQFNWVTLSPKKWAPPIEEAVRLANEFKIIVEDASDIPFYFNLLLKAQTNFDLKGRPIWLHPEWSKREDPVVLNAISEAVKDWGGRYRAGWQLHKLYQVDTLDNRTRPLVPLGGDPEKGY